MRTEPGAPGAIAEAFKPGTGPADSYWVIGMDQLEGEERANAISPQANQAIKSGGGGLF
jgi:penicillin-binding protein 1A